jgi:hypothetical protein
VGLIAASRFGNTLTTGSIQSGARPIPQTGDIIQNDKVVALALGAKLSDSTISFDKIADAQRLQLGGEIGFAGYTLKITQIWIVRYPTGEPKAGTDLERVVTSIKSRPGS